MKNLNTFLAIIVAICLLSIGCESEEGCLNPNSTNYDPGADEDCCCELPNLRLAIYPMLDTNSLDFNVPLTDAGGNEFFITNFKFFITKISLLDLASNPLTVRDTTAFYLKDESKIDTADRYILLDESVIEYEVGTFDYLSSFQTLEIELGLDDLAREIELDSLAAIHSLKNDEMYEISMDTLLSLTTEIEITGQSTVTYNALNLQKAVIPYTVTPEIAFDTWLELNLDYGIVFQGIDFVNDSQNTIANKIVTNLPLAISQR